MRSLLSPRPHTDSSIELWTRLFRLFRGFLWCDGDFAIIEEFPRTLVWWYYVFQVFASYFLSTGHHLATFSRFSVRASCVLFFDGRWLIVYSLLIAIKRAMNCQSDYRIRTKTVKTSTQENNSATVVLRSNYVRPKDKTVFFPESKVKQLVIPEFRNIAQVFRNF